MSKAFTLIETLIVVAIIAILSIILLFYINPVEQINRGLDTSTIQTIEIVASATDRYLTMEGTTPWTEDIQTTLLSSEISNSVLNSLISVGELKPSFLSAHLNNLNKIYLTSRANDLNFQLCFQPNSEAYLMHPNTIFSQDGEFNPECFDNKDNCYFCFTDLETGEVIANAAMGNQTQTDANQYATEEEELCADFDPEYPNYPWTCNYSSTWSQYSCTNYCVHDFGCDNYCPGNQRHLEKTYTTTGSDFWTCFSHRSETTESYCVPDPYAQCGSHIRSHPTDFVWGCENPRRSYKWLD